MSGDIAGFYNARRDADRAHGAVEHPIPGFARKVPLPPPSMSPPPSPPPASGVQPFTDVDARRERELQEALGKIAELEKQVKQLTMLERMASQAARSFTIRSEAGHIPTLEIELAIYDTTSFGAAHMEVHLDPTSIGYLERAGWTPPPGQPSMLDRDKDGCPCEKKDVGWPSDDPDKQETILGRTVPTCPVHGVSG